ncbi:hypothetical protein ACSBR1_015847 [Camellia fascicularis]
MHDGPVVPIGRNPRTDVLLKVEKAVLQSGGSVVRLPGLYISFMKSYKINIVVKLLGFMVQISLLYTCIPTYVSTHTSP